MKKSFAVMLLMLALLFPMFVIDAPKALAATILTGPKETIVTKAQRESVGLNYWPDGTMGILKSGSSYTFIGANGTNPSKTVGSLLYPISTSVGSSFSIGSMKNTYNYASGGPIYKDPSTGTLLMFYHAEKWPNGDSTKFYTQLGMAKSTDGGGTWTDLGEIVQPDIGFGVNTAAVEMEGAPYAVVGNYIYVYFRDYPDSGGTNELAVARALLSDVVSTAINSNNVVSWSKYYNGSWNEPALGGHSSALESGNPSSSWADVKYNSYLNKYVLVTATYVNSTTSALQYAESADGLTWSSRQTIDNTSGTENYYVTIVGTGSDPNITDGEFYVYFTSSQAGSWNRWSDAYLARRKVSVTGSAPTVSTTYLASSSFGSTQGVNNWYYQYKNGTTYTNMTWNSVDSYWYGDVTLSRIYSNWQHPDTSDSVRVWRAPQTGTVVITGTAKKLDTTSGDGVNVKILKNTTELWNQDIAASDGVGFSFNITKNVVAGEDIRFVVNKKANNAYDATSLDPQIVFTPGTVNYSASGGFSGTQGQNQWSYQYWNGSAYTNMTYDNGNQRWYSPADTYSWVYATSQHPDGNDSVRKWVAPAAGTITISSVVRKNDVTGGDGVNAKIFHNTTQIYNQDIAYNNSTGYIINLTRTVAAGDTIYFRLNKKSNSSYDSTAWDPVITYQ